MKARRFAIGPLSNKRLLRTQPRACFIHARRWKELDGCRTEALGGESQYIVAPFFIADDGHFFDMLTFSHHEAYVAPFLVPLPSLETFGNDQRLDFSFLGDRFLR